MVAPASGATDFVETAWINPTLTGGDAVRLQITGPCVRCVMTTLAQGDLPRDPGILRTAAPHNRVSAGVYATAERGGTIRRATRSGSSEHGRATFAGAEGPEDHE